MSSLQLNLPESIRRGIAAAAARDAVSVDQFVASVLAEKLAALTSDDDLARLTAGGDRAKFEAVLAKVPDVEPDPADALPTRAPTPPPDERYPLRGLQPYRFDDPFSPTVPPEDWDALR